MVTLHSLAVTASLMQGITGQEHLKDVRRAAFMGMSVDAVVRILLFLAVLGRCVYGLCTRS